MPAVRKKKRGKEERRGERKEKKKEDDSSSPGRAVRSEGQEGEKDSAEAVSPVAGPGSGGGRELGGAGSGGTQICSQVARAKCGQNVRKVGGVSMLRYFI